MNLIKRAGVRVKTAVKAGGHNLNHNATTRSSKGLRVKTAVKAGRISLNHNAGLRVRTALKAGRLAVNHNGRPFQGC